VAGSEHRSRSPPPGPCGPTNSVWSRYSYWRWACRVTYTEAGTYHIDINVMSGSQREFDWSDNATLSLTVEVS